MTNFDVDFRLRRLFHLLYAYRQMDPRLRHAISRQIKLLEIIRAAMERLVDEAPIEWKQKSPQAVWTTVQTALQRLLNVKGADTQEIVPPGYRESWQNQAPTKQQWLLKAQLSEVNAAFNHRIETIKKAVKDNQGQLPLTNREASESFLLQTDACETRMIKGFLMEDPDRASIGEAREQVQKAYNKFAAIDAHLLPIELFGDLHEKDTIATIRISPRDAQKGFSKKPAGTKVSGDTLHHFGGFFKRSWRSNDFLWGRLDGLCQLVESLLMPERLREVLQDEELYKQVRARVVEGKDLDPAMLFPHAGPATHKRCREWLLNDLLAPPQEGCLYDLLSPDAEKRKEAQERFDQHLELLIEAAQFEILYTEVKSVVQDAIKEQMEWNQFRVPVGQKEPATYEISKSIFRAGQADFDPLVLVAASDQLARAGIDSLKNAPMATAARPSKTALGQFFVDEYQVGSEKFLNDIPAPILLELLSTALIVTRNCLLGVFGDHADQVKRHLLYKVFSFLLWGFHAQVQLLRRAPQTIVTVQVGLVIVALLALAVGIKWWGAIIYAGTQFSWLWFGVFIVVPLLILLVEGTVLWLNRGSPKSR